MTYSKHPDMDINMSDSTGEGWSSRVTCACNHLPEKLVMQVPLAPIIFEFLTKGWDLKVGYHIHIDYPTVAQLLFSILTLFLTAIRKRVCEQNV